MPTADNPANEKPEVRLNQRILSHLIDIYAFSYKLYRTRTLQKHLLILMLRGRFSAEFRDLGEGETGKPIGLRDMMIENYITIYGNVKCVTMQGTKGS